MKQALSGVSIVGYGESPIRKRKDAPMGVGQHIALAVNSALESAGLTKQDVQDKGLGVIGTGGAQDPIWPARVAENLGLTPRWLMGSYYGGASSVMLLMESAIAIHSGLTDVALCVCADTPVHGRENDAGRSAEYFSDFAEPFGEMGPITLGALFGKRHMEQYGTKETHLGALAVSQRQNALHNPNAAFQSPITLDDYMNSRIIAYPLRLLDCPMHVDGATAYVVASIEAAKKLKGDQRVRLLGFGQAFNHREGQYEMCDVTTTGVRPATKMALESSALSLKDLSCFQIYDEYTITCLIQLEDVGLCERGAGGRFIESHDLTFRGDVPLNTGGGLLSAGQQSFAGGSTMLIEAIRQLRGEGGERQVKNAKTALVTGLGGLSFGLVPNNTCAAVLGTEDAVR